MEKNKLRVPKLIVSFDKNNYDLTKFTEKHPGGNIILQNSNTMDITQKFLKSPPHSNAAFYLLQQYKLQSTVITSNNNNNQNDDLLIEKEHRMPEQFNLIPEYHDLETLVDWSKAILPQIKNISDKYEEWVNKPVDRPLRLLNPWYLEIFTKTIWWMIPLFWLPVIATLIKWELLEHKENLTKYTIFHNYIIGVIIWSLVEYCFHRWVFHMKIINNNPYQCTLHFLLHGLHHKTPFDQYRLVFPPLPGALIAYILFIPISYIFVYSKTVMAGGITGYVLYDLIHYYLHYGDPNFSYFYNMKRYHYQHHFVYHTLGFGISNPFWDSVFNTKINLRALKYRIKWR